MCGIVIFLFGELNCGIVCEVPPFATENGVFAEMEVGDMVD